MLPIETFEWGYWWNCVNLKHDNDDDYGDDDHDDDHSQLVMIMLLMKLFQS